MFAATGDGVNLWWELVGDGPVAMLVPGRGDSADVFPSLVRSALLESGRSVLRFDPRNAGLSDRGHATDTLRTMANDVIAVMAAAQVAIADLIGVSMGGMLITDVAQKAPASVRSLTFLAGMSPHPDGGVGPDFFTAFEGAEPEDSVLSLMGEPTEDDRAWLAEDLRMAAARAPRRPEARASHQEAAFKFGWVGHDVLPDIAAPALVVHGTADRILPVAHATTLHEGLSRSELELVEGMGHVPTRAEWLRLLPRIITHLDSAV